MKNIVYRFIFLISLILISFCNITMADEYYDISRYDVNVNVTENNIYQVTEKIIVDFKTGRYGIFRIIPYRYYGYTHDISNISVQDENGSKYQIEVSRDSGGLQIKIGSPKIIVQGAKAYIISYTYDMGDDINKVQDEVYWNIIGTEWDCIIANASFAVTLPKSFDQSKVNLTSGVLSSTDTTGARWNVDENTVTGTINKPLGPREALTIAIPLQEGYFKDVTKKSVDYLLYIAAGFMVLVLIKAVALRGEYKASKNRIIKKIMFHPPANLNPSELGYIYDKSVDDKDVTSFIIYWANKGFLTIKEEESDLVFGRKSKKYYLTKLKDVETNNDYEKTLYDALFSYADGDVLDISKLHDKFYPKVADAKGSIQSKIDKALNVYDIDFDNKISWIYAFSMVVFAIGLYSFLNNFLIDNISSLFVSVFITIFITVFAAGCIKAFIFIKNVFLKILAMLAALLFILPFAGVISIIAFRMFVFTADFAIILALFVIHIINILLISNTYKLTERGAIILGEVFGFKEFLNTAEKPQLEALINETPTYFYDILPYAIVLDVTDKWADKFNDLVSQSPSWYSSNGAATFNSVMFASAVSSSMSSMSSSMNSTPSSSGGSSGGGGGGGGGGSW